MQRMRARIPSYYYKTTYLILWSEQYQISVQYIVYEGVRIGLNTYLVHQLLQGLSYSYRSLS